MATTPSADVVRDLLQLVDIAATRLENLRALRLSANELSAAIGGRYTYWRDVLVGEKSFGERIARKIEATPDPKYGPRHGILDFPGAVKPITSPASSALEKTPRPMTEDEHEETIYYTAATKSKGRDIPVAAEFAKISFIRTG